jgi:CheY-like chemotaxis protein
VLDLAADALGARLREPGPPPRLGTVLCVDDDPVYLRSISRLLSRHGYRVSAFDDADRALEAVPRLKPDVAVVDIMMPGMGGLDLAAKIGEASHGKVPVVFVTGLDSDEAFYEGHLHGRFVVEKTDSPEKVLDVVDSLAGAAK